MLLLSFPDFTPGFVLETHVRPRCGPRPVTRGMIGCLELVISRRQMAMPNSYSPSIPHEADKQQLDDECEVRWRINMIVKISSRASSHTFNYLIFKSTIGLQDQAKIESIVADENVYQFSRARNGCCLHSCFLTKAEFVFLLRDLKLGFEKIFPGLPSA